MAEGIGPLFISSPSLSRLSLVATNSCKFYFRDITFTSINSFRITSQSTVFYLPSIDVSRYNLSLRIFHVVLNNSVLKNLVDLLPTLSCYASGDPSLKLIDDRIVQVR